MKLKHLIVIIPLVLTLSACGSKKISEADSLYLLDVKKTEIALTKTDGELLSEGYNFCKKLDAGNKWIDVANSLDYYTEVKALYSYQVSLASVIDLCPKYQNQIINVD